MLHASVLPIRALLSHCGPGDVGSTFHLPGRRWLRDALTARSLESSTAHLNVRSLPVLPGGLGVQEWGAWGKRWGVSPDKLDPGDLGPLQGAWPEPGPACPLGALQQGPAQPSLYKCAFPTTLGAGGRQGRGWSIQPKAGVVWGRAGWSSGLSVLTCRPLEAGCQEARREVLYVCSRGFWKDRRGREAQLASLLGAMRHPWEHKNLAEPQSLCLQVWRGLPSCLSPQGSGHTAPELGDPQQPKCTPAAQGPQARSPGVAS